MRRHITFFYEDHVEKQTCAPIAAEAERRGFDVQFTDNLTQKCDIGVYCQHQCQPENAEFSVVMLHGMDQGRRRWPNMWAAEPWYKFDIGFLPGNVWAERWQTSSWDPYVHPKQGVYVAGWPKSDLIFKDKNTYNEQIDDLKRTLDLPYDKTILYAPSFESDGKQDDVVQTFKDQDVNILIKQWITEYEKPDYPDTWDNVQAAYALHRDKYPNVKILDPEMSIMLALGLSDLLITDESSIAYEALLFDVPSISFGHWIMRHNNSASGRPVDPPSICFKVPMQEAVDTAIALMGDNHDQNVGCDEHYANLGNSAGVMIDIIEQHYFNKKPQYKPLTPRHAIKHTTYFIRFCIRMIRPLRKASAIDKLIRTIKSWPVLRNIHARAKGQS